MPNRVICLAALAAVSLLAQPHPLDPLSKEEIAAAVAVLKSSGRITQKSRFPLLALDEPAKHQPSPAANRRAFAIVFEREANRTFETVVDLKTKSILSWKEIHGMQPPIMGEDIELTEKIVRADSDWRQAMRKRGISDFSKIQIDPWSAGYHAVPEDNGHRSSRGISYYRGDARSAYMRPIEGVVAYVDLTARKVFKLVDTGVRPLPKENPDLNLQPRQPLRPLSIMQPQVSFRLSGNEVSWANWRFRFAVHPREGLVLYTVTYDDHGSLRSIFYRASLAEMVVPYGDPDAAWYFRKVFDTGEYAFVARSIAPLSPGADVPSNAVFHNAVFAGEDGKPYDSPRAVAVYERDGGLLWRYSNIAASRTESRRARELVVSYIMTAGNYEYGFNWVFHQDGALELELLLTGIMSAKGVAPGEHSSHAHLVAENVAAVHHQHFFNFRLDLDVDGAANSVAELNTTAPADRAADPFHKAISMNETIFRSERESVRQIDLASARKWKVFNPARRNSLGDLAAYVLVPGENAIPYAAADSWIRRRAGFLNAHLWVTHYDPAENNAAGTYINQSKGGEGLPKWVQANRPLQNQDVVLWYTLGITHIPRPEDWPVMPVHRAGFKLIPSGFFSRSPAME